MILERTIKNCGDGTESALNARPWGSCGEASAPRGCGSKIGKCASDCGRNWKGAAYGVLCHELAHIYLGHLGADKEGGWPYRLNLPLNVAEIEAESVAYIVCRRAGLRTHSAEYLSSYVEDSSDLDSISIDLVSRAAAASKKWAAGSCPRARKRRRVRGAESALDNRRASPYFRHGIDSFNHVAAGDRRPGFPAARRLRKNGGAGGFQIAPALVVCSSAITALMSNISAPAWRNSDATLKNAGWRWSPSTPTTRKHPEDHPAQMKQEAQAAG